MKRFVLTTLAAAGLLATAAPAMADARSSTVFSNFVVTLTDLDPNDGITPSLSFVHSSGGNVYAENTSYGETKDYRQLGAFQALQPGLLSVAPSTEWASAAANVMITDQQAGISALSVQGIALSGLDGRGNYRTSATGPYTDFVLSANTRVTFSLQADFMAQTSMGYNLDADLLEYAFSNGSLFVGGMIDGAYQSDQASHMVRADYEVLEDNTTTGVRDTWSGLMSVSFGNTTAFDAMGQVQANAFSEGFSATWDGVTPVPEPGTYAMMLAGLALVGAIGRRRKTEA